MRRRVGEKEKGRKEGGGEERVKGKKEERNNTGTEVNAASWKHEQSCV